MTGIAVDWPGQITAYGQCCTIGEKWGHMSQDSVGFDRSLDLIVDREDFLAKALGYGHTAPGRLLVDQYQRQLAVSIAADRPNGGQQGRLGRPGRHRRLHVGEAPAHCRCVSLPFHDHWCGQKDWREEPA
jgi:hypothetical protein